MSQERIFGVGVVNQEVPVFPGGLVRDIMDGQRFFALAFLTRCFGIEDLSVIDFLMPHEDVGKIALRGFVFQGKDRGAVPWREATVEPPARNQDLFSAVEVVIDAFHAPDIAAEPSLIDD